MESATLDALAHDFHGADPDDATFEIADSCGPVYTHDVWSAFVDLAADQEYVGDSYGLESSGRKGAASAVLHEIAHRLVVALVAECR